jgi:hypothetical protein
MLIFMEKDIPASSKRRRSPAEICKGWLVRIVLLARECISIDRIRRLQHQFVRPKSLIDTGVWRSF